MEKDYPGVQPSNTAAALIDSSDLIKTVDQALSTSRPSGRRTLRYGVSVEREQKATPQAEWILRFCASFRERVACMSSERINVSFQAYREVPDMSPEDAAELFARQRSPRIA